MDSKATIPVAPSCPRSAYLLALACNHIISINEDKRPSPGFFAYCSICLDVVEVIEVRDAAQ